MSAQVALGDVGVFLLRGRARQSHWAMDSRVARDRCQSPASKLGAGLVPDSPVQFNISARVRGIIFAMLEIPELQRAWCERHPHFFPRLVFRSDRGPVRTTDG